ncbi:MAG: phosphatidate cytidylyltransferase [Lachnospiraceae bacterium]|nr:phosphatidate cytidylyltransferase [Lachnospiraceae bacterium]
MGNKTQKTEEQTGKRPAHKLLTRNFLVRTAVGIGLLVLIGVPAFLGGYWFFALNALLCLIGLWEFLRVFGIHRHPAGVPAYIGAVLYLSALGFGKTALLAPAVILTVLLTAAVYVFFFQKTDSVKTMAAFFGFFYTAVLLSYLYRIRTGEDGLLLLGMTFIAAWGTDIFAYLTGILFGKHKMAPVLSPKKSWEGAAGGLAGAALLGALFGYLLRTHFSGFASPVLASALICLLGGLISMVGDLTASAFKRNHGVKDYSRLFPGHGGVLDRFDSVILIAPLVYYLAALFR